MPISPKKASNRISKNFRKKVIVGLAFAIPLVAGYIEYATTYHHPRWVAFLNRVLITLPFSSPLFLSAFKFGKKFKLTTSIMIFVFAIVRNPLVFPTELAILFFSMEIYVIYSVMRGVLHDKVSLDSERRSKG